MVCRTAPRTPLVRHLELRDGDDAVELGRAPLELAQQVSLVGRLRHGSEGGYQHGQYEKRNPFPIHTPRKLPADTSQASPISLAT